MQSTITGVLAGLESANNNFVANMTYAFSSAYATLLPTKDIATAVAISLPSYDFDLFINGIIQAMNADQRNRQSDRLTSGCSRSRAISSSYHS
jgi:hypothetical protein